MNTQNKSTVGKCYIRTQWKYVTPAVKYSWCNHTGVCFIWPVSVKVFGYLYLLFTDLCTVYNWHHCHILYPRLYSTPLQLHTYTCLTACPELLPGGSQWQGGRDFTLDLLLTALWAPLLLPWFSWPTWSSWSKPLIIPISHPAALSLSLSNTTHTNLSHRSVCWFLPLQVSLAVVLDCDGCKSWEIKDLIPLCQILFLTAHWILENPLAWLSNPFVVFLIQISWDLSCVFTCEGLQHSNQPIQRWFLWKYMQFLSN